jgi:DNA-binding CsgD family transcriptional regulator
VVGFWPLVGRREELELVVRLVRSGESAGVVAAGPAGVGKTRFASEALRAAERDGCATAWSTATTAAATIPFGALAHLLPVPMPGPAGRLDLLRRASGAVRERAGGRRLVLAVDDAHLLDDASAALLHQLASTRSAFVVVTVRSGEPTRDPILALWKDRLAEYLELQPLAQSEVERLLTSVLGGPVDGATLVRLWETTRGNTLFLHELVDEALERSTLRDLDGVWRWSGQVAPGARLSELVASRIGRLSGGERDALELIAAGEPIGIGALERTVSPRLLASMQRRGLLIAERSDRRLDLRLAHPLYGETLRAGAPGRRALAARLAETLAATGARRREDLLRLATWRLESGDSGSPELLVAAAWRALAAFDPVLAERLAIAATERGGGFDARYVQSLALRSQARFGEVEALLAELHETTADQRQVALVADARVANLFWGMGMATEAERVSLEAEARVRDPDLRAELAAIRAAMIAFTGRLADALEVARPIAKRPEIAERARTRAGLAVMTALILTGGAEEARGLIRELREPALRLAEHLPFLPSQLLAAYTLVLTLGGLLDDAEAEATTGYQQALGGHAQETAALWAMLLGRVLFSRGQVQQASKLLRESSALFAECDPVGYLPLCLAFLAQARGHASDPAGAERALARAETVRRPGVRIFDADFALAHAWAAAGSGSVTTARQELHQLADRATSSGQLAYAALALHDLARLGDAANARRRLDVLAEQLDGPAISAYRAHAAALAADDGDGLDLAGAEFQGLGTPLLAAEAFAEASAAHRSSGRNASSARSAAKRDAALQACEGAATPALATAAEATPLTPREREIASLAATGLSNRAIAGRLVVSVRTVEHHLEHAYQKLGVNHRKELAALLAPPRTAPTERRPNQLPPDHTSSPARSNRPDNPQHTLQPERGRANGVQ